MLCGAEHKGAHSDTVLHAKALSLYTYQQCFQVPLAREVKHLHV